MQVPTRLPDANETRPRVRLDQIARDNARISRGRLAITLVVLFVDPKDRRSSGRIEKSIGPFVKFGEILKDASATAIYGSRGANGVILITTKKGKKGLNITVNLGGSTGTMDKSTWIKYQHQYGAGYYDPNYYTYSDSPPSPDSHFGYFDANGDGSPDLYVDWQLNTPKFITWDSFGAAAGAAVRIELWQDGASGPAFRAVIAASTPDTGRFAWTPSASVESSGTGASAPVTLGRWAVVLVPAPMM